MTRRQAGTASHLTVVSSSVDVAAAEEGEARATSVPTPPVLAGLLVCTDVCTDGGHAVGVVREVLRWDGQQLSLRLTLDPRTTPGPSDITIQVPLTGCPGVVLG